MARLVQQDRSCDVVVKELVVKSQDEHLASAGIPGPAPRSAQHIPVLVP